jgi:RNA recognition motif-containing protein
VENINRGFAYMDIKTIFNQYGPVKNVRINIDQKTGRFMGSVIVTYEETTRIATVL